MLIRMDPRLEPIILPSRRLTWVASLKPGDVVEARRRRAGGEWLPWRLEVVRSRNENGTVRLSKRTQVGRLGYGTQANGDRVEIRKPGS